MTTTHTPLHEVLAFGSDGGLFGHLLRFSDASSADLPVIRYIALAVAVFWPRTAGETAGAPLFPGLTADQIVEVAIRDERGEFRVLEDNLRCPSGVSYVLENRRTLAHVLPEVFAGQQVRSVAEYPERLLEALRAAAPSGCFCG